MGIVFQQPWIWVWQLSCLWIIALICWRTIRNRENVTVNQVDDLCKNPTLWFHAVSDEVVLTLGNTVLPICYLWLIIWGGVGVGGQVLNPGDFTGKQEVEWTLLAA